jgi:hypothetical protein
MPCAWRMLDLGWCKPERKIDLAFGEKEEWLSVGCG